eukprot:15477906-Alexandrium_andersonii.AAC.1
MKILRRQGAASTQVRIYGPPGAHLETSCQNLAPQGHTLVFDEMKDHFAQAPDFEFHIVPD